MPTDEVDFGSLTATQRTLVEIASRIPDDVQAAAEARQDVPTFRAIIKDACAELDIEGDSFGDRRSKIVEAYNQQHGPQGQAAGGKTAASSPEAGKPADAGGQGEGGGSATGTATSNTGGASHRAGAPEKPHQESAMPTAQSVAKKLDNLPPFLLPVAKLMAEGNGTAAKVMKALDVGDKSATNYLTRVSSMLGLKRMPRGEKASLIAEAMGLKPATGGNGTDKSAKPPRQKKPRSEGALAETSPPQASTALVIAGSGNPFLSEPEIGKLTAFADSVAGSELAGLIEKAITQVRCTSDIAMAVQGVFAKYRPKE